MNTLKTSNILFQDICLNESNSGQTKELGFLAQKQVIGGATPLEIEVLQERLNESSAPAPTSSDSDNGTLTINGGVQGTVGQPATIQGGFQFNFPL